MSYEPLIARLDKIASLVQVKGLVKEAEEIDVISNTLEKIAKIIPAGSNRLAPIFSDKNPKVKDGKDHFPIPDRAHGQAALQRLSQFIDTKPDWWGGSLEEFKNTIIKSVKAKFPDMKIDEEKYK